jgi:hypothetical protein
MRALFLAAVLALAPGVALAQSTTDSFLAEPDIATAQGRSAQQCAAMGCQSPTLYWWPAVTLPCTTGGTVWIDIQASGAYGPSGLTSAEVSALVPYSTMSANGCFPAPEGNLP